MRPDLEREAERLLLDYRRLFKSIDRKAAGQTSRAYGGVVGSVKRQWFAGLAERLVKLAWSRLGADGSRLELNSQRQKIPMRPGYLEKLDGETRAHILASDEEYTCPANVGKQIWIDGRLAMGIECTNHTGNETLKRILVDFMLLKSVFPEMRCYLFQLESQLGGDYSAHNEITYGSQSTVTLLSHFPDVDLKIFTFLKGERKADRPIHKPEFFKPLEKGRVLQAIDLLADDLARFAGK